LPKSRGNGTDYREESVLLGGENRVEWMEAT